MKRIIFLLTIVCLFAGNILADSTNVDWADVANKLIDRADNVAAQLSQSIKDIAPEIWRIAMRQVYVEAITDFFITIIVGILLSWVLIWFKKRYEDDDEDLFAIRGLGFGGFILLIDLLVLIFWAAPQIIYVLGNPEYAAINKIFQMAGVL